MSLELELKKLIIDAVREAMKQAAQVAALPKLVTPSKPASPGVPTASPRPVAPASPATVKGRNSPKAGTLDYDRDIKPLAFNLAVHNRPKLMEIYAELEVTHGGEIKPEQFARAKELLEAAQ